MGKKIVVLIINMEWHLIYEFSITNLCLVSLYDIVNLIACMILFCYYFWKVFNQRYISHDNDTEKREKIFILDKLDDILYSFKTFIIIKVISREKDPTQKFYNHTDTLIFFNI